MNAMTRIARLDRQLRRLVGQLSNPLVLWEVDSLLDQRLTLMAQRDQGYTVREGRRWIR